MAARKVRRSRAAAPRLQLSITDRGRPRSDRRLLRAAVRETLQQAGRPDLAVSLLLTDDAEIARLHGEFLGDPTPTDVISFDLGDGAEIVVSVTTARRCSKAAGHRLADEVVLYVVHGLLHCCGFDDITAADRRRMRAAERAILAALRLHVAPVDA